MGDITLSSNSVIRPYRTSKGSAAIRHVMGSTFAAGSSIVVGDVVQSDTNASSTGAYKMIRMVASAPSTAIYGIAAGNVAHDGSTGAGGVGSGSVNKTPVWIADRDTEFVGFSKIAGTASTSIGTLAGLKRDSTLGIWFVDPAFSTAGESRIRITDVLNPGDTNGAYVFRFVSSACLLTD